jgi:hypothetical protein
MSFDVGGIGAANVPGIVPASTTPASAPVAPASEIPGNEAVTVDLQGVTPAIPAQVSSAIASASRAYDQLAAAGQHVEFSTDPASGKLTITLKSESGESQTLSPSDVLRIAAGESPS